MLIKGTHTDAIVYAKTIEQTAIDQIQSVVNESFMEGAQVRIMPDVHAGVGCTIGTTFKIKDAVCPNLVGVDIGCGMYVVPIRNEIDFESLDRLVNTIPSGFNVHRKVVKEFNLSLLRCYEYLTNLKRLSLSMGTLGGGNHFIEVDECDGKYYLVIHTGSRNLGKQVALYYQNIAINKHGADVSSDALAYVDGADLDDYLHDMDIVQKWATMNRELIASLLSAELDLDFDNSFHTVHNYIEEKMLRKGAVSARYRENLLIPINMRDGSLLCVGKGNSEWNYSAPHGAGRLMSRGEARRTLSLVEFEDTMKSIYSSSVCKETIDEAPMAYKSIEEILGLIGDTVDVIGILKPVYNFKAH